MAESRFEFEKDPVTVNEPVIVPPDVDNFVDSRFEIICLILEILFYRLFNVF